MAWRGRESAAMRSPIRRSRTKAPSISGSASRNSRAIARSDSRLPTVSSPRRSSSSTRRARRWKIFSRRSKPTASRPNKSQAPPPPIESEPRDALHGPEQAGRGDGGGTGNDEARAIPRLVAMPRRDGEESERDHGELRQLDAGIEAHQGRNHFAAGKPELFRSE